MAAVPQTTLTWLWNVLTKNHFDSTQTYRDPNRTYHDVARALAQYPSFGPRTDVYTYENGTFALLLHLVGTLPVSFRGTVYKFPIDVWIPNVYPFEPPIVYVTPTADMIVRVGQHLTLEGRVYHHYLAHWADAWDRSSIVDLFTVLREVFAKEPPVKYRNPQAQPTPHQMPTQSSPPPVPPLPPELTPLSNQTSQTQQQQPAPSIPPQLPPKPGQSPQLERQQKASLSAISHASLPVPPLPPKPQDPRRQSYYQPNANDARDAASTYLPRRSSSLRSSAILSPSQQSQSVSVPSKPGYRQDAAYPAGRATPGSPLQQSTFIAHPQAVDYKSQQAQAPQYTPGSYSGHPSQPFQNIPQPQAAYRPSPQQVAPTPVPAPAAAPRRETPDLLTSPFELELPSIAAAGPAPPVPPNPEKDALLHTLSRTLTETLQSSVSQSKSAVHPLQFQSQALQVAMVTLQGEIAALNNFQATLQSNISVLQQSLHRADAVIADAQARISQVPGQPPQSKTPEPDSGGRGTPATTTATASANVNANANTTGPPPIDEVLVAPTFVGKQLYDLVADERGIQQAIYALQAALAKGVIGVDIWSRHTRGLAREAFMKRALIQKIGRGMGLEGAHHQ